MCRRRSRSSLAGRMRRSTMTPRLELNIPQAAFLNLPHKYKAYVAGFGSGKTFVAALYGLIQASTFDNELNLPDDYIPSLMASYRRERLLHREAVPNRQ